VSAAPAIQTTASPSAVLQRALEEAEGRWLNAPTLAAALPGVDRVRARCNELARQGWARRGQGPDGEAVWRRAQGRRR
jgi:hypothetical protein